jgi:hypothetical protein
MGRGNSFFEPVTTKKKVTANLSLEVLLEVLLDVRGELSDVARYGPRTTIRYNPL